MKISSKTRTAFVDAILAYVEDVAGARPAGLARAAGSAPPARTVRQTLDLGGVAALLETAAKMLDDDAVGLHFAAVFEFEVLGPFSYAVLHAPTVGSALRNLERYSETVAAGMRPHLGVDDRVACLHFPKWGDAPAAFRHLDEAAVLFLVRMLRRVAGPHWSPREIGFRHPAPADLGAHRRLLGSVLRFDQPSSFILLSAADLDRGVRDADRFQLPIVERHLQEIVSDQANPDAFCHELELQVASLVCNGHPSLRSIAPRLGMSARTLQRRLDERGLCYRNLVADVRMRIARHYLEGHYLEGHYLEGHYLEGHYLEGNGHEEHEPSLGEIAFLLGYSELSAFDRAFRRRVGTSPGDYRRRASAGARAGTATH
jgi:AraC-like DNA-binding protein